MALQVFTAFSGLRRYAWLLQSGGSVAFGLLLAADPVAGGELRSAEPVIREKVPLERATGLALSFFGFIGVEGGAGLPRCVVILSCTPIRTRTSALELVVRA